ncbi:SMI1/KNR4 family protein [Hymenobacter properus]|uniref:SMI1/KNR4 family protein n=1 Tax=Hymenobacter properus TaxID=2791026 RepID=A0A931FID2_9BACT|nr:SMI1/KNR4 family protein [Hymenobacter properus]MBF9140668.1 SMI1/KNR4 family protein [Hymenobacter properus]MBR7719476.1 SMI1/KNR4 family protein [Microvirga sp. SRT04]
MPEAERLHFIGLLQGPTPDDYLKFMERHNGGEGPIGNESYLALFRLDAVPEYNTSLKDLYSITNYTVFASDGGNAIFAFNRAGEVIEFDLIGLGPDEAIKHGDSFLSFLKLLP